MNKKIGNITVLAFFCLLSLGQLERVQLFSWPAFYVHDVMLCIFVFFLGLSQKKWFADLHQDLKKISLVGKIFLSWVGVGEVLALITGASVLRPALYIARLLLYFLSAQGLAYLLKQKKISSRAVSYGLFLFGCFVLYFGFLQYLFIPDTRMLFFLGWDDHYYRLISTMLDPGFTGILLVLLFLFAFERQNFFFTYEWGKYFFFSVCVVGILLTYSRATYLAFVTSLLLLIAFFVWKKMFHKVFLLGFCVVLFGVGVPLLPRPGGEGVKLERTSTIAARANTFTQVITSLKTHDWIIGRGLFVAEAAKKSEYKTENHAFLPDSWIATFLAGTGVVGLLLFLVMIGQDIFHTFHHDIYFATAVIAVLIHGVFNATVFFPFVVIFLLVWSLLAEVDGK